MGLAGRDGPRLVTCAAAALALHLFVAEFDQALAFAILAFRFLFTGLRHGRGLPDEKPMPTPEWRGKP